MCIRRETREKARRSLAFSPVSKPHTHITCMLRKCTSIVYVIVRVFDSYMVDIELYPRSGLTKYQKSGICCFSIKHAPLRSKAKAKLDRNQDHVFKS